MLHLINTSDGSHTLLNTAQNETYHSRHGALQESRHVYLKNGLHFAMREFQGKSLRLLEVGFGTGLNALLTLTETQVPIEYTTLEPFPLEWTLLEQLNYTTLLKNDNVTGIFRHLHQAPWSQLHTITPLFVRFSRITFHYFGNSYFVCYIKIHFFLISCP